MKTYGGVDVFLNSELVGGDWSDSCPGLFIRGEIALGTHYIGGWIGPRTGLDDVERRQIFPLPGVEFRPLACAARSQSIY
jgi:hypothetical protein